MKKIILLAFGVIAFSGSAHGASLNPGYYGCMDKKSYDEMGMAIVNNDQKGVDYLMGRTCIYTSQLEGLDISILDRGFINSRVRVYSDSGSVELTVPSEALPK